MHGRIDPHRRRIRILTRDLVVHVEKIAVLLLYHIDPMLTDLFS